MVTTAQGQHIVDSTAQQEEAQDAFLQLQRPTRYVRWSKRTSYQVPPLPGKYEDLKQVADLVPREPMKRLVLHTPERYRRNHPSSASTSCGKGLKRSIGGRRWSIRFDRRAGVMHEVG